MATACGLEANMAVAQRWLSNTTEPWALILDGADDPGLDLSPYLPVGNRGVVLITSRNPDCEVHHTVGSSELGAMALDEAVTLLLRTVKTVDLSDRSEREAARAVVQSLGCLTLAITQAGVVIRRGQCKMGQFCTLSIQRRKELMSQKVIQGGEDYRYTIYTTWEVSRQMIEEISSEAGHDALELLQIFSFFYFEGISEQIFSRAWYTIRQGRQSEWVLSHRPILFLRPPIQEWDTCNFRAAMSVLLSFSLIYYNKDNLICIHPLVHSWVRDRLRPSEEKWVWTQATLILSLSIPRTNQITDCHFRQALVPHIDMDLGFREDGIFALRGAGEDRQWTATNFTYCYRQADRKAEALELMDRIVEAYKSTLSEEHPDTLSSMRKLAIHYSEAGRRTEALELTKRVVKIYERTLGREHPATLRSLKNLAIRYSQVDQRKEALELTEQVVELRKRILGEEHPDTLCSIHNLATRYSEVDRQKKALKLTEQVVEARKRTLGDEHPDTLASIDALSYRERNLQHASLFTFFWNIRKRLFAE